jgi:hypothetical protein
MLMALLGFFGGFLPKILTLFERWQDNKHEKEMFALQMKGQEMMHRNRLEEINVTADIQESIALHEPIPAYGVSFLDKMDDKGYSKWLMIPLLYLYTALDALQIVVRPGITLALTAFYMVSKYALYQQFTTVYSGEDWFDALLRIYTDYDRDLLTLVLSYWFGSRLAKTTLGKANEWQR